MSEAKPVAAAVPAATILIVREAANGMEVFMVKRHHQIDFVAGALVFPGGKATKTDFDPALGDLCDGMAALSSDMHAVVVATIREAFEESGILFARAKGEKNLIGAERLATLSHYRQKLEKAELSMLDMLRAENLRIAGDSLAHFAHWVTPTLMPKRFDTHFFVAAAPEGHAGAHDGHESVDLGVDQAGRCDRRPQALERDLPHQAQSDEAGAIQNAARSDCCREKGAPADSGTVDGKQPRRSGAPHPRRCRLRTDHRHDARDALNATPPRLQ